MVHRREWLTLRSSLLIVLTTLFVACGGDPVPTATLPGVPTAVTFSPLPSPTPAGTSAPQMTETTGSPVPTRAVSGVPTITGIPTGDSLYVDPQGRFSLTVPKDWQLRAPTNAAGIALVSFDAPDALASLTITLESVPLGTTSKEFAAGKDKAIASKMTNYKKQGQESLTVSNVPAEALTYQGTVGNKDYLFRHVLVVEGADGWNLTFPLDPTARQRYGPIIDTITQGFAFGRPLDAGSIGTAVTATKSPNGSSTSGTPPSTVKLPAAVVDWKPTTPLAAGIPVRLPDAGVIAQLNGVTFTTKAGSKATLGADEQFLIADLTIWNLGTAEILPLPEQFSVTQTQEKGASTLPETREIAADVAGGKVPAFGKVGIPPGMGVRGLVVIRAPKQATLLILSYQPSTTQTPQPAQFSVKP